MRCPLQLVNKLSPALLLCRVVVLICVFVIWLSTEQQLEDLGNATYVGWTSLLVVAHELGAFAFSQLFFGFAVIARFNFAAFCLRIVSICPR
jgi:hypothetical protein